MFKLLRNFHVTSGLMDGTRLEVHNIHEKCLELEIVTGEGRGKVALLARVLHLTPLNTILAFSFKEGNSL